MSDDPRSPPDALPDPGPSLSLPGGPDGEHRIAARPEAGLANAGPRHPGRVFDSLAEGVWERNLNTDEVWYSPRYKALLGFADDELPNAMESMRSRMHPDDQPAVRLAFASATDRLGEGECRARMLTRSGQWRWMRGRVRVWPDDLGRPELLIGALLDVHDEVLATGALKAEHVALEERVRERTGGSKWRCRKPSTRTSPRPPSSPT